jgi:hypothetical protein
MPEKQAYKGSGVMRSDYKLLRFCKILIMFVF